MTLKDSIFLPQQPTTPNFDETGVSIGWSHQRILKEQLMNKEYLLEKIRDEIRRGPSQFDLATIVTRVLSREGLDLRREPSLETMKHLIVGAARAANERQCTAC